MSIGIATVASERAIGRSAAFATVALLASAAIGVAFAVLAVSRVDVAIAALARVTGDRSRVFPVARVCVITAEIALFLGYLVDVAIAAGRELALYIIGTIASVADGPIR